MLTTFCCLFEISIARTQKWNAWVFQNAICPQKSHEGNIYTKNRSVVDLDSSSYTLPGLKINLSPNLLAARKKLDCFLLCSIPSLVPYIASVVVSSVALSSLKHWQHNLSFCYSNEFRFSTMTCPSSGRNANISSSINVMPRTTFFQAVRLSMWCSGSSILLWGIFRSISKREILFWH